MPNIDETYLQQLRDMKLYVSKPFAPGRAFEYSVWIAKPTSVSGNRIDGYDSLCASIPIDAPAVMLQPTDEGWVVLNQEHSIQGPGDFRNIWKTQQEAVEDILDFYFGNPERMNVIQERVSRHGALKTD